jgi:hypothetical protein
LSAQTITRSWSLDALTSAGATNPRETLAFAAAFLWIRSVTIDNASNCVVGIFLDADPYGMPSFTVPAGTFKTQPMNAQRVGVAIQSAKGDQPRGTVYAHLSEESLSAASGVSAGSGPGTMLWDVSKWDDGSVVAP